MSERRGVSVVERVVAHRRAAGVLIICLLGLVTGGCGCSPGFKAYTISVTALDLKQNMDVDFVGVSSEDAASWEASMDSEGVESYFGGGNARRSDARAGSYAKTLTFLESDGPTQTKVIEKDDEIWTTWKKRGTMNLVVTTNRWLDDRTLAPARVLTLDRCHWKGSELSIEVGSSGMRVLTATKEP